MSNLNLNEIFGVIDLEKVKSLIEQPIDFSQVHILLAKYEKESRVGRMGDEEFLKNYKHFISTFDSQTEFLKNRASFNSKSYQSLFRKKRAESLDYYYNLDFSKIIKYQLTNESNPDELITLDTMSLDLFDVEFTEKRFKFKLTPLGVSILDQKYDLIEKLISDFSHKSLFY